MIAIFKKVNKKRIAKLLAKLSVIAVSLFISFGITYFIDLKTANNALLDYQFNRTEKAVSSELVVIAIDDESLAYYPSWPWPRGIYAEVLKKLESYKVRKVAFDIDFSSDSDLNQDLLFAEALNSNTLEVALASYISKKEQTGALLEHQPIAVLKDKAAIVNANVSINSLGNISQYEAMMNESRPSIASYLADLDQSPTSTFYIDYSFKWSDIPVYSIKDLLTGKVAAEDLRGKNILIGATALVLGDTFNTPSSYRVPGVYIHALAYETLIRAVQFTKLNPRYIDLISALLIMLVALTFNPRKSIRLMVMTVAALSATYYSTSYLHTHQYLIFESVKILASVMIVSTLLFAYAFYLKTVSFYREQNQKNFHKAVSDQVIKGNANGIIVLKETGDVVVANQKAKKIFDLKGKNINLFDTFKSGKGILEKSSFLDRSEINYHKLRYGEGDSSLDLEIFVDKVFFSTRRFQGIIQQKHELYCFVIIDETAKNKALEDVHRSKIALLDIKFNDPLTKIANRHSFDRYLQSLLEGDQACFPTIILLSLDSLREINYIYGWLIGDSVICKVSEMLVNEIDKKAKVFRFSRSAFAIVSSELDNMTVIKEMQRLFFLFTVPLKIQNQQLLISVSLGASQAPVHGREPSKLTVCAETALSHARGKRNDSCFFYDEVIFIQLRERAALKQDLRRAISNKEFVLHYQPQHCLMTGDLVGLEGLIRWNDPIKGMRYPDEFIAALEDFGFMGELGQLVIDMGCQDALLLPKHIKVAINVSPIQFLETDLVQLCTSSLEKSGLQGAQLELEITESMLMDDVAKVSKVLNDIKGLGVSIAMDDFGTGYSSLQYLSELPFDKLKIDRSFTMNIVKGSQDEDIITSIINLGKAANKTILAEGIENEKAASFLAENGCNYGQGFLYGRPKPISSYL